MSGLAGPVHEHARRVAEGQLERTSGRLSGLPPEQKRAVDDLARALAGRVADSLLEGAAEHRGLEAALESIYGRA